MENRQKHIRSCVNISIGFTALVDLRRFYHRGRVCACYDSTHGCKINPPDSRAVENLLDEAMRQMRLMKAQEVIDKAEID
jgi:hypothetical protein